MSFIFGRKFVIELLLLGLGKTLLSFDSYLLTQQLSIADLISGPSYATSSPTLALRNVSLLTSHYKYQSKFSTILIDPFIS